MYEKVCPHGGRHHAVAPNLSQGFCDTYFPSIPRVYAQFIEIYRGDTMYYPLYLSLLGENKVQVTDIKAKRLSQNSCDKTCDSSRQVRAHGEEVNNAQT